VAVVPVQIDLTDYKRVPYLQDILAKVTDQ